MSQNPDKIRTDGETLYLDAVNIFNQDIVILPRGNANEDSIFNIYADNRSQAMEYAAVLVPLGVRPSSIFYHYIDSYGNSQRSSL